MSEPTPDRPSAAADTKRRVLLVEDHTDIADMLAALVERLGHEVRIAHNGPAALATAAEYRPEVVLLDIGLPGMDGYEIARRLREAGHDRALLVALTGYGQDEDRRRSKDAGFDHHVVKPVRLKALSELLGHPG